jgi:hypothetical protein
MELGGTSEGTLLPVSGLGALSSSSQGLLRQFQAARPSRNPRRTRAF